MLPLSALLVGCGAIADSEDIKTSGIYASISTSYDTVNVILRTGSADSNTAIRLSSGDDLSVEYDGRRIPMREVGCDGLCDAKVIYQAAIEGYRAGELVRVLLEREVEEDAVDNSFELPGEPKDISASPDPVSRSRGFMLTWGGTSEEDDVEVRVSGCGIEAVTQKVPEAAHQHELDRDDLAQAFDGCTLNAEVASLRSGRLDPAFAGGTVRARTHLSKSFETVP